MHKHYEKLASATVLSYFIDSMKLKQTVVAILFAVVVSVTSYNLAPLAAAESKCGGVNTAIISCGQGDGKSTDPNDPTGGLENSGLWGLLLLILNVMTAGVGILAVGGIVYGSVLYTTAADKAEQTKKAIGIITNVVIGIVAYALMYLVLNFLIPGGIFG